MINGLKRRWNIVLWLIFPASLLAILAGAGALLGWPLAANLLAAALLLLALLSLAGWAAALWYRAGAARAREAAENAAANAAADEKSRLQAVLRFNQGLADVAADAADERRMMDAALSAITRLTGALGCSFVPVDEWQQPLPAFTYGQLPQQVLSAWSTHLASGMLRERCGSCQILQSSPGACPLHPAEVGDALAVFCLPVTGDAAAPASFEHTTLAVESPEKAGQTNGVLHLYLPAGRALDAETRAFLAEMINQLARAYAAARLRAQEQVTLRQLQMLRSTDGDFFASLGGLLDGLIQALGADFALIRLRSTPYAPQPAPGNHAALNIQRGTLPALPEGDLECMINAALSAAAHGEPFSPGASAGSGWLALPLAVPAEALPENGVLEREMPQGVLIVGIQPPRELHPRQQTILETVAAQAALIVANERLARSLEYRVVIAERARLAREIHDGLAQTLAFLKLQSAQMQSYLAQGNLARLSQVLNDNYQALAEAYLDTRQSIDNLRLTPQDGLEQWLERVISDFENTTGLRVERGIQPLARPLAPEVQAQLVRIVQEALSNVRKHSQASQVRVSLRPWGSEQILEVSDDGIGFDAGDVPEIARHGLRGMRERAEMIGADFQIISQAHQGTTVRLVLPFSLEEETSL